MYNFLNYLIIICNFNYDKVSIKYVCKCKCFILFMFYTIGYRSPFCTSEEECKESE